MADYALGPAARREPQLRARACGPPQRSTGSGASMQRGVQSPAGASAAPFNGGLPGTLDGMVRAPSRKLRTSLRVTADPATSMQPRGDLVCLRSRPFIHLRPLLVCMPICRRSAVSSPHEADIQPSSLSLSLLSGCSKTYFRVEFPKRSMSFSKIS